MTDPSSQESAAVLCLDAITKQFSSAASPAVSSVSFTLQQGDLLALLGPSGCGKTTLLRLIAGFEQPQSGSITIAEQIVAGNGTWVAPEKRGVGMVFQDYALFPHLTVQQNIAFGLRQKPGSTVSQRVQEAIALVGLQGMEQRYPHQLSGGQQQRVALARALAPYPFLVLLDEPLSNLDVQVRLRLRQELREILKAAGTSAIFVTHDQEEALSIADRVAVMRHGQLEQLDTPEAIYRQPASRFVAEFVTQANFLSACRQDQVWQTVLGKIPVTLTAVDAIEAQSNRSKDQLEQVELMVRQEDLSLEADETSDIIVRDRQFLGREYRYWLQTSAGQELVARTAASLRLPIHTRVQVTINTQRLQVFVPLSARETEPDRTMAKQTNIPVR
ncbi:ABC transporter ATP-binding protein [Thermocoleostomius sinensis]|uniref:ABC-type quaternary amine transporter n=1 Tax=Thermocoleostomius sinensis A174 TaxID=2016057 RepID=A0A9E8ZIZ1_9CYAN|nr:ABC transporter ATP-binding protein [Thermocoleostomius sinensis]WAL62100.1 ABC transporter ATP-binding protein [Thermocoleostomius sinensis A174]